MLCINTNTRSIFRAAELFEPLLESQYGLCSTKKENILQELQLFCVFVMMQSDAPVKGKV